VVWVSTLKRTQQTAAHIPPSCPVTKWRALVEIEVGTCNALTYEEVEKKFPEEAAMRKKDKLRYRYPQGESYMDVIDRLEPVIFELERIKGPVLVVCHPPFNIVTSTLVDFSSCIIM
jgi:6-phosphofructo-2-kinase/fructose-2,6-biphosphatase